MTKFVNKFNKFQSNKRKVEKVLSNESLNEAVVERGDKFVIGGIVVKQSFVRSYMNRVKKETGKDLSKMMGEMEAAEEIVKYIIDKNASDIEEIPVSALLPGEEGMEEEVDDISITEEPADVSDDTIEAETEEESETEEVTSEEDEELSSDIDDDFESLEDETETETETESETEESEEETEAESEAESEAEEGEEESDLPL
jgi:hypothetical protein